MVQCSCSVGSRPFLRARRIPSPPLPQGRCGPPADTGRRGPPTGTGPIRTTGSEGHRGRPDLCHAIASRRSLEVNGAESSRQPTHPPRVVSCRVVSAESLSLPPSQVSTTGRAPAGRLASTSDRSRRRARQEPKRRTNEGLRVTTSRPSRESAPAFRRRCDGLPGRVEESRTAPQGGAARPRAAVAASPDVAREDAAALVRSAAARARVPLATGSDALIPWSSRALRLGACRTISRVFGLIGRWRRRSGDDASAYVKTG